LDRFFGGRSVLIDVTEPMGNESFIYFEIEKNSFIARVNPINDLKAGKQIKIHIDIKEVYLFNKSNGRNIVT
jgi:multiple sugar transport system ATP-binding protein